jgi:hypothetical protein
LFIGIVMSDYYVYLHRRAHDGVVFYVGKGKNGRSHSSHNRSRHWHNTVNRYGYIVEFVCVGIQEWYALELEVEHIAFYGRHDLQQGTLVNFTDGGEGTSGRVFSEDALFRIGEASKKRILSDEARLRMSLSQTGRKHSPETLAKIAQSNTIRNQSQEQRDKISKKLKGKPLSDETKQKLKDAWVRRKAKPD